ncbi:hypothetical protein, partial [Serratia fonticola]|uniref:hypothetical protein n=1 Tax=Serratia fonticola TaxID=47917 RepID=UPI00301CA41F
RHFLVTELVVTLAKDVNIVRLPAVTAPPSAALPCCVQDHGQCRELCPIFWADVFLDCFIGGLSH